MKLKMTGGMRDIANSAWISTTNEAAAKSRTDEEVERVVRYLVNNHHTSPLESVTMTFFPESKQDEEVLELYAATNKFIRLLGKPGEKNMTTDLLNFVKVSKKLEMESRLTNDPLWNLFSSLDAKLSEIVSGFPQLEYDPPEDVSNLLGEHDMKVELINVHDGGSLESSRATWRIRCPLSITIQVMRHRSGSFNQVSGRYRTINQDVVTAVDDCSEMAKRCGFDLQEYLDQTTSTIKNYKKRMSDIKKSRDDGVISNQEYKRLREFLRYVLSEGRMTEMYVTFYLDDFYGNYLKLRDSIHAQTEHIWVAQNMKKTLEQVWQQKNI